MGVFRTALATVFVTINLFLFSYTAQAAHVTFRLRPSDILSNPSTLPPTTSATLFRHSHTTSVPLTRRNTFEFKDISPGSYLFTVHCRDYKFGPLRVDVTNDAEDSGAQKVEVHQTFWGNEWRNKGEKKGEGKVRGEEAFSVDVLPQVKKEYYTVRAGFSPIQFLKNPMILMALFSLVLIVGIPYMTDMMDDETRAEFEAMKKQSPVNKATENVLDFQNFDLASWMAGKSTGAGSSGGSSR